MVKSNLEKSMTLHASILVGIKFVLAHANKYSNAFVLMFLRSKFYAKNLHCCKVILLA